MCGILGQFTFKGKNISIPPLNLIRHRGPDGEGEWYNSERNVYLGHTRLAILEPTPAGRQPMHDSEGRYTITFNGEIYNHLALRELLPHVNWRGTSDTETLIELFALKGVAALPLLKGMFAFAIHDSADNSLLLVRDRLGIKPLWFRDNEESFCFSSEVRPLLQPDEFMPKVQALSEYIGFGHLPGSGEIFNNVQIMSPGSWIKLSSNGESKKKYWWPSNSFNSGKVQNRKVAIKRVKELVSAAIEEHLISDVGVGTFLSGGIDSSIVTLVAGKKLGKNLKSFTVGFPQGTHDERLIARQVAKRAGADHYELEVNEATCLSWVTEAVSKLDLPSVDAINTYIVSKAVRDTGLKVALSGLGGDELFGGYPSFKNIPKLNWLSVLPGNVIQMFINLFPQTIKDKLGELKNYNTADLTINRRRFASVASLSALGLEDGSPGIPDTPLGLDTMGIISWAEIHSYMVPMLLRDSDQMSMAVGLEIRVPFLDHCLVEEVLSFPQKFKKGYGVKPLLVDAFRADLPTEVYDRPKQGFTLPMEAWIRGPLAEFTREGITTAVDLLHLTEPSRQYKNFQKGVVHWTRVWQWCIFGHWLKSKKWQESPAFSYQPG